MKWKTATLNTLRKFKRSNCPKRCLAELPPELPEAPTWTLDTIPWVNVAAVLAALLLMAAVTAILRLRRIWHGWYSKLVLDAFQRTIQRHDSSTGTNNRDDNTINRDDNTINRDDSTINRDQLFTSVMYIHAVLNYGGILGLPIKIPPPSREHVHRQFDAIAARPNEMSFGEFNEAMLVLGLHVYGVAIAKILLTLSVPALLTWAWNMTHPRLPTSVRHSFVLELLDELDIVPLLLVLVANVVVVDRVYDNLIEPLVRRRVELQRRTRARLIKAGALRPGDLLTRRQRTRQIRALRREKVS